MKNSILAIAVAATMAAPAAMAAPTVYGNVHVSINDFDNAAELDMTSNTSSIGVKGSEDLGDGMKAIYKVEFQLDAAEGGFSGGKAGDIDTSGATGTVGSTTGGNALTQRDVWIGIKGGMGTAKFGTLSSNYKQMGGKVDPLYRTRLEGRGFLNIQSKAHGGRGITSGRATNLVQLASNKYSGIQIVANTTISGAADETTGLGVRWANKNITAYFDWIDNVESMTKIGAKYKMKGISVGLQYEDAADVFGEDYLFLSGSYSIDKNNAVMVTAGQVSADAANADRSGIALAYNHKLSKMTNVYVGYGDRSDDVAANEDSVFTVGVKKKF